MKKKNKHKILIVEDDYAISDIYSSALGAAEFDVISAVNGQEGLEKAISETPELILLDVSMPVMDGFEMLKKLRESGDYGKRVPVILLTNMDAGNEDVIKKVAETGPSYYIVKSSFTPEQIIEKVREKLAR